LTPAQTEQVYSLLLDIHRDGGATIDAFGMDEALKRARKKLADERLEIDQRA
jgi:hypothetical protein